jgi:hypothetical protein
VGVLVVFSPLPGFSHEDALSLPRSGSVPVDFLEEGGEEEEGEEEEGEEDPDGRLICLNMTTKRLTWGREEVGREQWLGMTWSSGCRPVKVLPFLRC